jgi:hypothetical protein
MFSLPLLQDKPSEDDLNPSYINIALLLLQTIGLFHQNSHQRASAIEAHATVVQVT